MATGCSNSENFLACSAVQHAQSCQNAFLYTSTRTGHAVRWCPSRPSASGPPDLDQVRLVLWPQMMRDASALQGSRALTFHRLPPFPGLTSQALWTTAG